MRRSPAGATACWVEGEHITRQLIPAGSRIYRYQEIEIEPPEGFVPPTPPEMQPGVLAVPE